MPMYLNNEYSFEAEDRGFFDSLLRSFYGTAFKHIAPAESGFAGADLLPERTQAQNLQQVLSGFGVEGFVDEDAETVETIRDTLATILERACDAIEEEEEKKKE